MCINVPTRQPRRWKAKQSKDEVGKERPSFNRPPYIVEVHEASRRHQMYKELQAEEVNIFIFTLGVVGPIQTAHNLD
eukprot:635804-Pelagomonas_calceolata.AAC.1